MFDPLKELLLSAMLDCGDISKHELRPSNEVRNDRRWHLTVERDWCTSVAKSGYPSPSAAVDKVFGTPELLEKILTYVDPIHLLSVRRVSRTLREIIKASTTIRTAMFFETILPKDYDTSGMISIVVGEFSRTPGIRNYIRTLRGFATLDSIPITQPSPKYVSIYQRCYCNNSKRPSLRTRKSNGDLTYKDIFELIDALQSCPLCYGVRYWLIKASYISKRKEYELRKRMLYHSSKGKVA